MIEIGDQIVCRELAKPRCGAPGLVLVADSVNTPMPICRLIQSSTHNLFAEIGSDVCPVLDDPMIHIENVERIVRRGVGINWSKSFVG